MTRHYLMCPPTHFTVKYEINPWMDRSVTTDADVAMSQWEDLRAVYRELGHTVEIIDPLPDYPDMVFAANGGTVLDGVAYGSRFAYPERAGEGAAFLKWLADHGYQPVEPTQTNEGEGDFVVTDTVVLAGTGFRSSHAAHLEAQELFGRPVVSLRLVDPRFYHLDTALTYLGGGVVAYYPAAFSPGSQRVLGHLYPDAIIASEPDAMVLGLNAVSDGTHVVLSPAATGLAAAITERGFEAIGVDTSELLKGGGGAKCCTLELRRAPAEVTR